MEMVILILIAYFAAAVMAIQIAESVLSYRVKSLFKLHIPMQDIKNISNPVLWYRLFNHKLLFYVTLPFTSILMFFAWLHQSLSDLLNCSYCTSYWTGLLVGYFLIGFNLPTAIIFAFISTGFVIILKGIKQY